MIKAIFFDIDGTLVSFKTHTVPASAIEAIQAVRERGVKIFIASGRMMSQIDNLNDLVFDGYITMNGACCLTADGKVIFSNPIPRRDLEALIDHDATGQRLPFTCMTKERTTINYRDKAVAQVCRLVDVPLPPVRDPREVLDKEVFQLNIFVDEEREKQLLGTVLTGCESSRWNPLFADVNVKGNSKATGIEQVLRFYGLETGETMAIGDGGNDVAMLRHVSIGVAMGNAVDAAKAAAGFVTDDVDRDGVAKALQKFCLSQKTTGD